MATARLKERDGQFIFKESEFEDESFHAPSFISKYRRVSSLESLKEQLRAYCETLKQELFIIINRDYKDFITIATKVLFLLLLLLLLLPLFFISSLISLNKQPNTKHKNKNKHKQLDGVDIRTEHLRKPLVDLRMDLASLHDGLHASIRAIESKLNHRAAISNKRRLLEASLLCMSQLDLVEKVVEGGVVDVQDEEMARGDNESGLGPVLSRKKNGRRHRRDLLRYSFISKFL